MQVSTFTTGKTLFANVYLSAGESISQFQSEIDELKKTHRVIVYTGGAKDLKETLVQAITGIC